MIFNKTNLSDIKKYYSNNIVKFAQTEDRLWQIVNIGSEEIKCVDVDGFELYINLNEDYEVDFPLPGRVVYQHGAQAALLCRKPAKQYNRGISEQNTCILTCSSTGSWHPISLDIYRLQQFVDKPAYQDINNVVWEETNSVALNKHYSVCKAGMLFALNKRIGDVSFNAKQIKLKHQMFFPQVSVLFPGWSIK